MPPPSASSVRTADAIRRSAMLLQFAAVTERFRFRHGIPGWDFVPASYHGSFSAATANSQRLINHSRFNPVNQRPADRRARSPFARRAGGRQQTEFCADFGPAVAEAGGPQGGQVAEIELARAAFGLAPKDNYGWSRMGPKIQKDSPGARDEPRLSGGTQ